MIPDTDTLIADICRETQLSDLGDESFRPALSVLIESLNTQSNLTREAIQSEELEIRQLLTNRLRMQEFFRRYPEIENQEITAPVIIVGLQRTGTSKLFRVIAADPQWNILPTWQAVNPVPLSYEHTDGPDPRIALTDQWVDNAKAIQTAHTFETRAPEMEALLLRENFMINSPRRLCPKHQAWCETADLRPAYLYLRRQLQFLQWQNGYAPGRRWILKSPPHLHNLPALMNAFPDAKLVMTHRHPAKSVASMLRLVELSQESAARKVDKDLISRLWVRVLSLGIERFLEFYEMYGDELFVNVSYAEVEGSIQEAVRRIYDFAGAPFSEQTKSAIETWEHANPRHKEGVFKYNLKEYGLTDEKIKEEFGAYIACFSTMIN